MAKTREQKEVQLQEFNDELSSMKAAVVVDYKGLKVSETEKLRKILRSQNVDFRVAKISLLRRALENQGITLNEEVFKKPIAIAFSRNDEVAAAKELYNFAKEHEALEILGGVLENHYIDKASVTQLASLPSKEELYARFVGTVAAPLSGMVNVLAANIRGLVNVINARKESIS
ncbi:MAG: 50S ribosomal protein L10 [Patescibacteria group bacterium]|jgi:large subunit ribosomal protein L10